MPLPKVLIVEDDKEFQYSYKKGLAGVAEIISAFSVEEGRQKFAGPMVAPSSVSDYRKCLMDAGCDRRVFSKYEVIDVVLETGNKTRWT